MAGCDARQSTRAYYTDVAKALPEGTVILTAGCAKYRYNKLPLGDIGGIPRVLDAGQCNDSYSLALVALKLKEIFGLDDVNKLPLSLTLPGTSRRRFSSFSPCSVLASKTSGSGLRSPASFHPRSPGRS